MHSFAFADITLTLDLKDMANFQHGQVPDDRGRAY